MPLDAAPFPAIIPLSPHRKEKAELLPEGDFRPMGYRRTRRDKMIKSQTALRRKNSPRKEAQHARRHEQMLSLVRRGSFPYTPGVMSWLSVQLGKKAARITPQDVQKLLA